MEEEGTRENGNLGLMHYAEQSRRQYKQCYISHFKVSLILSSFLKDSLTEQTHVLHIEKSN